MVRRFLVGFARIPPGLVVLSSLCGALLGLAVSTLTAAGPSLFSGAGWQCSAVAAGNVPKAGHENQK